MIWIVLSLFAQQAMADTPVYKLTLREAERQALISSNLLRSYQADEQASKEEADAQYMALFPKLAFQGSYEYYAQIPQVSIPAFGPHPLQFGTNNTYSIGPTLSYTLWDTFSSRDSYRASSFLSQAREEDRKNTELQVLASLRAAYVQVQLGNEELGLIDNSLELARAQDRDVMNRFRAGAADRLDVVTSRRSVLSYQIQLEQEQAQLSSSFRDLLNLLGDHGSIDASQLSHLAHLGPSGVPGVTLVLQLDSLREMVAKGILPPRTSVPGNDQPQIHSQELQAESFEQGASSQSAKMLPTIQVSAAVAETEPDIPDPPSFLQETVGVTLTLPLYLGDPSHDLAESQRSQADAARFRAEQLKEDLSRDFSKAREMLESLRTQRELAMSDVAQSEEEAKLYFTSYKAGKINLIDVQNANNQALQAKVNMAKIDAQILDQIITLRSLAGPEYEEE